MSWLRLVRRLLPAAVCAVAAALWAAPNSLPPDIGLTDAERVWIAQHPIIRVGHDLTYAPYSMQDGAGNIVGIDPDYLAIVTKRTGLQFRHETRKDWESTLEACRRHELDLLPSVGTAPERESYLAYTASYNFAPNVIITRNDTPGFISLSDLTGRTIAVPRGYAGLRSDLDEHVPGYVAVEFANSLECYQAVAHGEAFASIGDGANAAYLIRMNHLSNLRMGSIITATPEIYFGVRKDWPELVSILNKVIASMTPIERKEINDRWIAIEYQQDRWWVMAFKVAAGIAAAALAVFLLVVLHNRRLAGELEERRRVQQELEVAHQRLARVSEEKSELLRTVAHDLRGPLTGLMLGTDMLRIDEGRDHHVWHSTLDQMRNSTQQMMRLVNDLVDANVIEEGRRVYQRAPVDAPGLVHEAVAAYSEPAARKQIRLAVELEETDCPLVTDAAALRQVLDNLISNALKYSPPGSPVTVGLRRESGRVQFRVRDEGPGLSAEDQGKLFQKYVRGSARPTGGEKSTGLGLWIVHRTITSLGGTVRCESEPGRGAVFIVELPPEPAPEPPPESV
jgi:two-component system, NarL family, sensor histidine kinase EvgS